MKCRLILLLLSGTNQALGQDVIEIARRVAAEQEAAPWFWSAPLEGHARLRYSFEMKMTRRLVDQKGREVKAKHGESPLTAWRSLRFEYLPLDWGSHQRCLEFEGRSPCPEEWNRELERQAARRTGMSAAEREGVEAVQRAADASHAAWWRRFPESHQIEYVAPDRLRFQGEWTGELTFDPATYRIRTLSYRHANGGSFHCEMTQLPDGTRVPSRAEQRSGRQHRVTEYSNYRRFTATSVLR